MCKKTYLTKVNRIKELDKQINELKAIQDKLKEDVKKGMTSDGIEEMEVGDYTVRYKAVTSQKFDTSAFKKAHSKMYEFFCNPSVTMRFTIN